MTHAYLNAGKPVTCPISCQKAHFTTRKSARQFIDSMRKSPIANAGYRPGGLYPYRCPTCSGGPWHIGHRRVKPKSQV